MTEVVLNAPFMDEGITCPTCWGKAEPYDTRRELEDHFNTVHLDEGAPAMWRVKYDGFKNTWLMVQPDLPQYLIQEFP